MTAPIQLTPQVIINNFIPVLLGVIAYFLFVGPEHFDPHNIAWIKTGDGAQHYLGWNAFRLDSWRFPIGLNPNYGADISSSIVFSDSIPLLAIFFKLLDPVLSPVFQYFGIWTLLCFVLQAWLAWRLVGLIKIPLHTQAIATSLFLVAPPMLMRVNLHAALTAHFLVLASLYLNLTQNRHLQTLKWFILLLTSVATHFYLFVIVVGLWGSDLVDEFINKKRSAESCIKEVLGHTALIILIAWQLGYLADASNSTVINHYGAWSPNLLVFFNADGWSYLLKNIYKVLNEENTNFLGLGIIFLLFISIWKLGLSVLFIKQKVMRYPALIAILAIFCILAFSNFIAIGNYSFEIPLPTSIKFFLSGLRSSGRFLWPLYYLLILLIITITIKGFPRSGTVILFMAVTIQLVDTSAKWIPLRNLISQSAKGSSIFDASMENLKNPFWDEAGRTYKNVLSVPLRHLSVQYFDNGENWDWHRFASYANKYQLATNFVYLSRPDELKIDRANTSYETAFKIGEFDNRNLYILDREKIIPALIHLNPNRDLLAQIDGVNILAPNWKNCATCYQPPDDMVYKKNFNIPEPGISFSFAKNGSGIPFLIGIGEFSILGRGWSYPEAWGTWSDGSEARLVIPLPRQKVSNLLLEVSPFTTPNLRSQTVQIWINGQYNQTVHLTTNHQSIDINLHPKELERDYIAIKFLFFNQASLAAMGMGDDRRTLALGLISGKFK